MLRGSNEREQRRHRDSRGQSGAALRGEEKPSALSGQLFGTASRVGLIDASLSFGMTESECRVVSLASDQLIRIIRLLSITHIKYENVFVYLVYGIISPISFG